MTDDDLLRTGLPLLMTGLVGCGKGAVTGDQLTSALGLLPLIAGGLLFCWLECRGLR